MIIAYVGSGGKTTAIHRNCRKYLEEGKKVLVTTSTHMYQEEDTLVGDDADKIIAELETKHYCMAGQSFSEHKICPLSRQTYEKVCQYADVVLVEADGSKQLPIKVCREFEPVIYENVDEIKVVIGLAALGKPVKEVAFNLEGVCSLLNISQEERIQPIHLQKLVYEGYVEPLKEKYPEKTISVLPSQLNTLYQKTCASLLRENKYISLLKAEWFEARPKLIILGAGHVAKEVAFIASRLEFDVKVVDDREAFANRERFLFADEVICDDFQKVADYFEEGAYYIVVTRGHLNDLECVDKIMHTNYAYLGMIGSRKKISFVKEKLVEKGHTQDKIETLHSPIGLSIGAVTPAEIAISILAEIVEFKNRQMSNSISKELLNAKESGVLCILTNKSGSSPRDEGSMMLVGEDDVIDTIGGGLIEYSAIQFARTHDGVELKTYDLDSNESAEAGMVCGGSNDVLFIPIIESGTFYD